MNEADFSAAGMQAEEIESAGGRTGWHSSVLVIILLLGILGIVQMLFIRAHLAQEMFYLAYFIPIGIAAMYLSWRSAIEVSVLTAIVYMVAMIPNFYVQNDETAGLFIEAIGHAGLYVAVGIGLSTYRYRVEREKEKALHAESERVARLKLMLEVSTTVSSSLKIDQVLQVLAVRIAESTAATFCRISILDDKGENLSIVAAYPVREMDWEPSIGRALPVSELPDHRKAIETKEAVIVGGRRRIPEKDLSDSQRTMMDDASSLLLTPWWSVKRRWAWSA